MRFGQAINHPKKLLLKFNLMISLVNLHDKKRTLYESVEPDLVSQGAGPARLSLTVIPTFRLLAPA